MRFPRFALSLSISPSGLEFVSNNRVFTTTTLLEAFIFASGGDLTSVYFTLQSIDLSEAILAVETHANVQTRLQAARQPSTGHTEDAWPGQIEWEPENE